MTKPNRYTVGELAKEAADCRTLQHYDNIGLLHLQETEGGRRYIPMLICSNSRRFPSNKSVA